MAQNEPEKLVAEEPENLPSFKRDVGGMLTNTQRAISNAARAAADDGSAAPSLMGNEERLLAQHCSHGSHG